MKIIGYARVSTQDQNLDAQLDALRAYGCAPIITDRISGVAQDRAVLDSAIDMLADGDRFVVAKIDRLGRSVQGILGAVDQVRAKGAVLVCLSENLDTSTITGRFVLHILAALAQVERELIVDRVRAGLASSRARGVIGGRPKAMRREQEQAAIELLKGPRTPSEVAKMLGLSRSTMYRFIKNETALKK